MSALFNITYPLAQKLDESNILRDGHKERHECGITDVHLSPLTRAIQRI